MKLLYPYVFIIGMSITALEMSASRFLAPYFGSSTIVWANVIGIILIGLAIGYFIGGRLADKFPKSETFYATGLLGGIILAIIPIFVQVLLGSLGGTIFTLPFWEILGSFMSSILLFGIPVLVLALLSPYAVRIASENLKEVGTKAGSLYAWSTVGSVMGIYISTFVTIPFLGLKETMWLFSLCIIVLSIIGIGYSKKKALIALFPISLLIVAPFFSGKFADNVLAVTESLYQHIKVIEREDNVRFLVFNEGGGIQSVYAPDNGYLSGLYYDYYPLMSHLNRFSDQEHLDVLVLGYAGGTIGKLFKTYHPEGMNVQIDGVEIDGKVTNLSEEYFGVEPSERTIYTQDGRSFLRSTEKKYDIIIVDAYSQEHYIPPHMITEEFFKEVNNSLTEKGVLLFNINAESEESLLLTTTLRTVEKAFGSAMIAKIPNSYNYLVLGNNGKGLSFRDELPSTFPELLHTEYNYIQETIADAEFELDGEVFTDNKSPIDYYTHLALFNIVTGHGSY